MECSLDDFDDHSVPEPVTPPPPAPPSLPAPPTVEPSKPSCSSYRLKRTADDPKTLDNARRKRKRALKIALNGHQPHRTTVQKVIQASSPTSLSVNFATFPAAAGAYQAKIFQPLAADIPHSAASLSLQGFEYLPWNGTYVKYPTPCC